MGKENQGEEQGQRIPSESARTRNTTTTYSTTYLNIKKIFNQLFKQIRPFSHYLKTPKSS
jgi:hypothetical protein